MERIGKDVERELARSGAGAAVPLASVTAVWPATVGDAVARNAWPLRIGRDGTLHVATSSATWAAELEHLAEEIRERLHGVLRDEAPRKLRFAVGPVPEGGLDEGASANRAPAPIDSDTAREATAAAAAIDDPELRELVLRAAVASLARSASDRRF